MLPLAVGACASNGASGGGGGGGGAPAHCGLGPLPLPTDTGEPCESPVDPHCPAAPRAGATTFVGAATCAFGKDDTGCTPITAPTCPGDRLELGFSVVNPNAPTPTCAGDVDVRAVVSADGTVDIEWRAQEKDASCQPVGKEMQGHEALVGPCCATDIDAHFPVADFTFRVRVQSDWQ